ncbi:hypothetical protein OF83DRAFT_54459 [Amylostereum chailletii]|nr:hypothetical protein OF83DRAFT_54459 [Amylostereum chailletii]
MCKNSTASNRWCHSFERAMALPAAEEALQFLPPAYAIFDAAVTVTNRSLHVLSIQEKIDAALQDALGQDSFWEYEEPSGVSLMFSPTEMKKETGIEGQLRLACDLATSYRHLDALGLVAPELFGAVCDSGLVAIHVMFENGRDTGEINYVVSENAVTMFSLHNPVDFLHCYSFFYRLYDRLVEQLIRPFMALTPEKVAASLNKKKRSWRAPEPDSKAHEQKGNQFRFRKSAPGDGDDNVPTDEQSGKGRPDGPDQRDVLVKAK